MKCKAPYWKDPNGKVYGSAHGPRFGAIPFGCGQCMACRINVVRTWQHRIMLEAGSHLKSAFVTLTFDEDHVPEKVTVRELQLFLKRFRKQYGKIRYFGVGEYGENGRPHYHLALFGVNDSYICPKCDKFNCPNIETKKRHIVCEYRGKKLCLQEEIMTSWTKGIVQVGDINKDSAGYIAGYAAKGATKKDSENREFVIQSRQPGLGHDAVIEMAKQMHDVPKEKLIGAFTYGKNSRPLGRYLTQVLMQARGQSEVLKLGSVNELQDDLADELQDFEFPYEVYRDRATIPCDTAEWKHKNFNRRTL